MKCIHSLQQTDLCKLPLAKRWRLLAALAGCLAGCASTKVEGTGAPLAQPLCTSSSTRVSVMWAPLWRPDQKEPPLREAAAERGMARYVQSLPCAGSVRIHRLQQGEASVSLTAEEALALARAKGDEPDKVVLLTVRELGPKLFIGLPTLVEGGTEVVLEARVVQAHPLATLAAPRMHWQKGGPFYIKGVKSLDLDMQTALSLTLPLTFPALPDPTPGPPRLRWDNAAP